MVLPHPCIWRLRGSLRNATESKPQAASRHSNYKLRRGVQKRAGPCALRVGSSTLEVSQSLITAGALESWKLGTWHGQELRSRQSFQNTGYMTKQRFLKITWQTIIHSLYAGAFHVQSIYTGTSAFSQCLHFILSALLQGV